MPFLLLSKLGAHIKEAAKEAGNVLFMILIAVAMFAALAYAVTGSTRSGGGDASKETNNLTAAQIVQYSSDVEMAVQRMRLSNGCTDTQISFENPIVSGYTNPNAPADYRCHVFRPEGGAVVWQSIPITARNNDYSGRARYGQPWFTGQTCIYNVGTGTLAEGDCWHNAATNASLKKELMIAFPLLTKDVCEELNRRINPMMLPLRREYNTAIGNKFTGAYPASGYAIDWVGVQNEPGSSGCIEGNSDSYDEPNGSYVYYHVLIPR